MKKYLEHVAESNRFTTKGMRYEIVSEDATSYMINGGSNEELWYSKTPDSDGDSYATWFKLVEEAEAIRKIDGRKAKITSPGLRFPNYGDFAAKHGYPDASVKTLLRDTRQKPQEGDIVTLLTSGAHLTDYPGDTLWIVEAANGERHIFSEKGLRILSDTAQQINGLTDTVAKLTLKVTENERRIAELLEAARPDIDRIAKGLAGLIMRSEGSTGTLAVSNPDQRTRDAIIERAKRDVAELALNDRYNEHRREASGKEGPFYLSDIYGAYAEFIVNKEKRTVVCLLRGVHTHDVLNRGIARCAPDECFNVYLGKAISLRRALGLEVPVEYVKAPAPTEARVGDVVAWRYGAKICHAYEVRKVGGVNYDLLSLDSGDLFENCQYTTDIIVPKIIDDSREGTEVGAE